MLDSYADLHNPEHVRWWIEKETDAQTLRHLIELEDSLHAGDEIGALQAIDDLTLLLVFQRGEGL